MKSCNICKILKTSEFFYRDKSKKLGISNTCKACSNARKKKYDQSEIGKLKKKEYRLKNREKILSYLKKYYKERNKESTRKERNSWRLKNIERLRAYYRKYQAKRELEDLNFRIGRRLRARLRYAIKVKKEGSAVRDLGCSVSELKAFLESKFQPGMTWDNYGHSGWHIDHIKPLSAFNLQERTEFLKACHYTNLQPLWASDNLIKSDKYPVLG